MRNVHKVFALAAGVAALAACQKEPQPEQNIVIDTNADRSPAHAWERWIRDHITRHIPSLHRK